MLFGALRTPLIQVTVFPSEASTVDFSTMARWPPEARSANPISCVVGKETASTTRRMGNLVISLTFCEILASERLRSRTFVAPMAFRCSVCFREAVVMIGESPDNFASWMPTFKELNKSHFQRLRGIQKKMRTQLAHRASTSKDYERGFGNLPF
jgi:hypothetical protein